MQPLSPLQLHVIGKIEQYWHKNEVFPPLNFFEKLEFDINENLKHETFRLALHSRGIDVPAMVMRKSTPMSTDGITNEQLAAITTIVNFEDKRSRSAKLRELGITTTQWAGWMKDKKFKNFLQEMSATHLQDVLHVANEGLLNAAERGDVNAIKFYYQLTGRHTEESGSMQNLRVVLARVVESIQRHVQDPDVLRAISADFEVILAGGIPTEKPREIESII